MRFVPEEMNMGLKALRKVDFDRYLEMSDQKVWDDTVVCDED